ncbi:MAG: hypothetical protein L3J13_08830 [Devosiaceae bacterium]|nr:hypothetical protein [Devosiaceae bacterium]
MPSKPRKSYLLRINEDILLAMTHWSDDELRSLNGQIEYVLRDALRRANRLKEQTPQVTLTPPQETSKTKKK